MHCSMTWLEGIIYILLQFKKLQTVSTSMRSVMYFPGIPEQLLFYYLLNLFFITLDCLYLFVCVCRPDGCLSIVGLRPPPLLSPGSQRHLHLHWWAAPVFHYQPPSVNTFQTFQKLPLLMCEVLSIAHTFSFFVMPGHMSDLLLVERDLVTSLKDYIRAEEDKLKKIKQ